MAAPTLDQLRARHAWALVQRFKKDREPKVCGREAKRLPARVLACGLGQALAFLVAKKKAAALCDGLSEHLASRVPCSGGQSTDLLARIVQGDSVFLRRATDEALAYLQWVGRFAEAEDLIGED